MLESSALDLAIGLAIGDTISISKDVAIDFSERSL